MGCCFSLFTTSYKALLDTTDISLLDQTLPILNKDAKRLSQCSESECEQLRRLFYLFSCASVITAVDNGGGGDMKSVEKLTLNKEDVRRSLVAYGKTPTEFNLTRSITQMHLSSAPKDAVDFKGFTLAILSGKSVLYDYLYTDYDTVNERKEEERAEVIEEEKKKKKGWFKRGK